MQRNVLNTKQVDNFLLNLFGRSVHDEVHDWLCTVARKWVLKQYPMLLQLVVWKEPDTGFEAVFACDMPTFDAEQFRRRPWGVSLGPFRRSNRRLPDWAFRDLQQGRPVHYIPVGGDDLRGRLWAIIDYLNSLAGRPEFARLNRMSFDQTEKASQEWHERLTRQRAEMAELQSDVEVLRTFPDGYSIVSLLTKDALLREGNLMGHCVGSYHVDPGNLNALEILSLRDPKNQPHCTLEVRGRRHINQMKGRANGPVKDKYAAYVRQFIAEGDYRVHHDGANVGLIQYEGRSYIDVNDFIIRHDWKNNQVRHWNYQWEDAWSKGFRDVMRTIIARRDDLTDGSRTKLAEVFHPDGDFYVRFAPVDTINLFGRSYDIMGVEFPIGYLNLARNGVFGQKAIYEAKRVLNAGIGQLLGRLHEDDEHLFYTGKIERERRHPNRALRHYDEAWANDRREEQLLGGEFFTSAKSVIVRSQIHFGGIRAARHDKIRRRIAHIRRANRKSLSDTMIPWSDREAWRAGYERVQEILQDRSRDYL